MAILRILWLALWRPAAGVPPAVARATRAGPARARALAYQGRQCGRHPLVPIHAPWTRPPR